ncbi:BatA and WFA domain-containing protein [Flavobacterium antarcticum]|uniref:vWA domain-containing protein n=1 Tax=Flavobacterium antarcticum TaxID=271155 RepID=UPI0003B3F020|nr:BatA and WFA domain-containing protein [Flavobacterium antarcticum]
MQFKHPEILYFLFLLLIPILVHLFQLRRFKKEYFTNVQFLKELSLQTRKSSKIKKWLLLATRLLILTALIIAFAQPFFAAKDANAITNETYIVVDNSFSMQAQGQKGPLLKRILEDLQQHLTEDQTFSLITSSESFWDTDIKSSQKEIQNLNYSPSEFSLNQVLSQIKSRKTPFQKDVIIISDFINTETKSLEKIDKEFNTFLVPVKAEQKNNISIDSVFIKETSDKFYEIGFQLTNFGTEITEIPLGIYNENKLVAKSVVKFDSAKKEVFFTLPKQAFNGYASITDNGLAYDNELYFSISEPKKMNILSIGSADKSKFLSKIYNSSEFNYSNVELNALNYNLLEKQDVIVLNELAEIPQALQTTLSDFAKKDGNIIVIPSSESKIDELNNWLKNLGNIRFSQNENNKKLITKISFSHPLYKNVFEKNVTNFQFPSVNKQFAVSTTSAPVLRFEDDSPFLTAIGKVYVFSAALNKENSNFQNSPLIVPTFYNMVQNTNRSGISAMQIGVENPLTVDAQLQKEEILKVKQSKQSNATDFVPSQQIRNNKVQLTFDNAPEIAGNYGIYQNDDLVQNISFNYARTESNLNDPVADLSKFKTANSIESIIDTLQTDRTNNEIWKWFAILTLLFLITELFIQKFVK